MKVRNRKTSFGPKISEYIVLLSGGELSSFRAEDCGPCGLLPSCGREGIRGWHSLQTWPPAPMCWDSWGAATGQPVGQETSPLVSAYKILTSPVTVCRSEV